MWNYDIWWVQQNISSQVLWKSKTSRNIIFKATLVSEHYSLVPNDKQTNVLIIAYHIMVQSFLVWQQKVIYFTDT